MSSNQYYFQWKSSHIHFGIVVPKSRFQNVNEDIVNNTCSFELRQKASESLERKVVMGCELKVKSVLSRIVPPCSDTDKKGWSSEVILYAPLL